MRAALAFIIVSRINSGSSRRQMTTSTPRQLESNLQFHTHACASANHNDAGEQYFQLQYSHISVKSAILHHLTNLCVASPSPTPLLTTPISIGLQLNLQLRALSPPNRQLPPPSPPHTHPWPSLRPPGRAISCSLRVARAR